MEQNRETLGKRIMALRKAKGWTQEQLAAQLGISAQAVSKWENDVSCPDISTLPALAALLGVRVDTLLGVPAAGGEAADLSQEAGRQTADDASQAPLPSPRVDWGGVAFAIALILLGLSFILNKQLGLSPDIWGLVWPSVVLGLGVLWFLRQLAPFGLGVAFVGFYYLLQNLGDPLPFTLTWDLIWPMILILLGVDILLNLLGVKRRVGNRFQGRHWEHWQQGAAGFVEEKEIIQLQAVFTEDDRQIKTPCLRGGKVRLVFGAGKLDLTQVQALGDRGAAVLNLEVVFGGYTLFLPRHFRVDNQVTAVFGGSTINGSPWEPTATLTLTGKVIFGGLDIRYVG